MPQYKKYPTVKELSSQKQRKAQRHAIFAYNKTVARIARKARRLARKGD